MTTTTKKPLVNPTVFVFVLVCACRAMWIATVLLLVGAANGNAAISSVSSREKHPAFVTGFGRQGHSSGQEETKFQTIPMLPVPNRGVCLSEWSRIQTQRHQKRSGVHDDDDDEGIPTAVATSTSSVPNYWRTTPDGVRIVDDAIGRGEELEIPEDSSNTRVVARVRCETQIFRSSSESGQPRERVVFLELSPEDDSVVLSKDTSGVTLLVVCDGENTAATTETNDGSCKRKPFGFALQETLSGMRVGGRRRVLIPPTSKVRFVGPGAVVNGNGNGDGDAIIVYLRLEAIEPPSSWNAIFANTVTSGGALSAILLLARPFLSPLGLISFLIFVPLIVKKTVNGFAAYELYMDIDADTVYPIKALLEWRLKF